ncbi:39S ribosomal protein L10, mitochondrial [Bradysia coprophila]|uniref:39S ribosomal protein L10, mitochondrial n=1 Tax=Bradysia coprophila TaxID=38358 RepID=UPI00187DB895|nr:39S ribosomal protein L10, mitochondrial [Bradysia coprophila]
MLLNRSTNVLAKQCSKYGPNVKAISTTQQCYRGKINIQRPRAPHYDRALFNVVTEPIIPRPTLTQECYQRRLQKQFVGAREKVVNPYEVIIAKEVFKRLNESKMVAIFHVNSINADDMFKITVDLHRQNMHLKAYGKAIMEKAVVGSPYETILPLFGSKNCIVFCEEANVGQLLKIIRKAPQLILLAGIVENQLLSKNELVKLSKLPDLTTARAQFVGVLNSVGSGLVSNLQAHQTNLCNLLDLHAKPKDTEDDGAKNSDSVEST